MTRLKDGGIRFDLEELEDRPWLGDGDDLMKIVHVDEAMGQVVYIQRFGPGSRHPEHTHHCTAIAYTLAGCWRYEGDEFPQGAICIEPMGSSHYAETAPGETAEVLVIFTAGPDRTRLIEVRFPDGATAELDVPLFKRLSEMTSNEEWRAFVSDNGLPTIGENTAA